MSFLVSETPFDVMRLVLPPASVLMIILPFAPIHFPHSSRIFCSAGCRVAESVFDQSATTEEGTRYRTRNFCLGESVMVSLCLALFSMLKYPKDDRTCLLPTLPTRFFVRASRARNPCDVCQRGEGSYGLKVTVHKLDNRRRGQWVTP